MVDENTSASESVRYLPVLEAIVIGTVAGLSAVLLLYGIKALGTLRIQLSSHHPAYIVLPAFGLVGGLIAGLCVHFAPEVSGSGIPQVRALLSRISQPLNFKLAIVKLFGGVVALGGGLFMGREGPTVQVGAALAAALARRLPNTAQHRRRLIASGAGAGLAAAFNAPIAGVTFVMEELLKEASAETISLSLVACFSASVMENLVGEARAHSVISGGHAATAVPLQPADIGFYVVLGLLCAFFGAVFNNLILAFLRTYRRTRLPVYIRTAFAGLFTGLVVSTLPDVFHNYAQMRSLINAGTVAPDLVPIVFTDFFLLVLIAYGSGAPGGLFAPSLALGASLGYMVGYIHWQLTGTNLIDIFTQVGMGGLFAAVARVPLTATVIVFEMSGNFGLIPPLMLACVLGSAVAEVLSKGSLYDLLMVWSGINLRGPEAVEEAHSTLVRQIMQRDMKTLAPDASIADATQCINGHMFRGCPVLRSGKLVGVITTTQIEIALQTEGCTDASPVSSVMITNPVSVSPFDSLDDIMFLFSRYKFVWLPVADDGRYMGIVTRETALKTLFPARADDALAKEPDDPPAESAEHS